MLLFSAREVTCSSKRLDLKPHFLSIDHQPLGYHFSFFSVSGRISTHQTPANTLSYEYHESSAHGSIDRFAQIREVSMGKLKEIG